MIQKNQTWVLVDRPCNKNIIGVEWIFKTKLNVDGLINSKRLLYGLKQAPRSWNSRIDDHLLKLEFKKSLSEATLYIKTTESNDVLIVSLYDDDLLLTRRTLFLLKNLNFKC